MPTRSLAALLALLCVAIPARAQFLEEFDGGFESFWGTFPFASGHGFQGFPDHSFEFIGGANAIRLDNRLGRNEYNGMSPEGVLVPSDFHILEVRYQLLSSSGSNPGTDMPLQLGIVSPGGGFVSVGITDGTAATRNLRLQTHVAPEQVLAAPTQDDTWYRLRIENHVSHLGAALLADDGMTEIAHADYPVNVAGIQKGGTALYITVTQRIIGLTAQIRVCDVAIDRMTLTVIDCPADFTGDLVLDLTDVSAFIAAFTTQNPAADLNNDGVVDLADISLFINAFTAGCP
jgi:hypothetical protein